MIDPARYPLTAHYLASLPNGLASYPECLVKSDAHDGLRDGFPQIAEDLGLPTVVRQFFRGEYHDEWMPETLGSTVVHLVRDACFADDHTHYDWCYQNNGKLFKKPHYRVLMALLSPTLLLTNAAKRWATMHQGSTLVAQPVRRTDTQLCCTTLLHYPSGMFDELDLRNIASGYRAALDCSRAKNPATEIHRRNDGDAEIMVTWDN